MVGIERFAKRHRQTINELLDTDFCKSQSDSTFRLLMAQLDFAGFDTLLRNWMAAQPGVDKELDTLVTGGKTLPALSLSTPLAHCVSVLRCVSTSTWAWRLPRPPTPPLPVAKSRPCASGWRQSSLRVCWCRPTRCTRSALSLYFAQGGADFLIADKHTRRKRFRLIRDRLIYSRRIPWRTSKREMKRGRDIT